MLLKILYLLPLVLLCLLPILLDGKLKVEGSESDDIERIKHKWPRWKGPKTDERINRMLAESIELLKGLGVPISNSIAPEVKLTSAHSYYGMCCPKGSRKYCTDYEYYIEISGFTLENTEKSLRNTLIHELIHTVPGGLCHTGEWKKWAKFVSEKTGYNIQHYGGDETAKDEERLRFYGHTKLL